MDDRLFTAAAHRFAPVLETWAANAERRARPDQPDLFPEDSDNAH